MASKQSRSHTTESSLVGYVKNIIYTMKKIHDLRNLQQSSRAVVTVTLDTYCQISIETEYYLDDWRALGYKNGSHSDIFQCRVPHYFLELITVLYFILPTINFFT